MFTTKKEYYGFFRDQNTRNLTELMQYLAYDEDTNLFLNEDNTFFFCLEIPTVIYISEDELDILGDIFNIEDCLPGDIIQVCLFSFYFRDNKKKIDLSFYDKIKTDLPLPEILNNYINNKNPRNDIEKEMIMNRINFFEKAKQTSLIKNQTFRPVSYKCWYVYRSCIPIENQETEKKEKDRLLTIISKIKGILSSLNLVIKPIDNIEFLSVLNNIFLNYDYIHYNSNLPLKEQIANGDLYVENLDKCFIIDTIKEKKYVSAMTIKQPPSWTVGNVLSNVIGDYFDNSGVSRIPCEFMMTLTVIVSSRYENKLEVEKKQEFWKNRIIKGVPEKLQEYQIMLDKLNNGINFFSTTFSVFLFCNSEDEVKTYTAFVKSLFERAQYQLQEEKFLRLPLFIASLPGNYEYFLEKGFKTPIINKILNPQKEAKLELGFHRSFLAFADNLARIAPIYSDGAKIIQNPTLLFVGKRGELIPYDIFQGSNSYSTLIFGGSGKGKSVLINEMLFQYASEITNRQGKRKIDKIFLIEVGYSFRKIANILGAKYFDLSQENMIPSLNPFKILTDDWETRQDREQIVRIIQEMVQMMYTIKGNLDPSLEGTINKMVASLIEQYGSETTVDDLYRLATKEIGIHANSFFDYTKKGVNYKFFDPDRKPLLFDADINIISIPSANWLGKDLMMLLMYSLVSQINTAVYKENHQRKIVIIDEAHNFLENVNFLNFSVKWVRELRKYDGAVVFATQSILDFVSNIETNKLLQICANKIYFSHEKEKVLQLQQTGGLPINEMVLKLLYNIATKKGQYSEFLVQNEEGFFVGRLFIDPFSRYLYSTSSDEVSKIEEYTKQGYSLVEAINKVIENE